MAKSDEEMLKNIEEVLKRPVDLSPRQGWRTFECDDCGGLYEFMTRDYRSPSGEDCPDCQGWMTPSSGYPDLSLQVDKSHNLVNPNYLPRRLRASSLSNGNDPAGPNAGFIGQDGANTAAS